MTGYSEEGDIVVMRVTREDYDALLVLLGIAVGALEDPRMRKMALRIANSINRGNPRWTPYWVGEEDE